MAHRWKDGTREIFALDSCMYVLVSVFKINVGVGKETALR
jgi:hypothetical protein